MAVLNRELDGLMDTNVPGLVEYFINKQHINPTLHLQTHNTKALLSTSVKKNYHLDKVQDIMLGWIASIFKYLDKQHHSRSWQSHPTTCMDGVCDVICRLDGAIMSRLAISFKIFWSPLSSRRTHQMAKYVYQVFKAMPLT
jgi:hypothetical protein